MSWLDDTVSEGELLSQAQRLNGTTSLPPPGAFRGALSAIGPGLLRGAIEGGSFIETTALQLGSLQHELELAASARASAQFIPEDEAETQIKAQQQFRETQSQRIGEETAETVNGLRPDPATTGVVGQILHEAAAVLPRTIAASVAAGPVAGAIAAGAPAAYSRKRVSMAEGIDESTATFLGAIEGVTTGIGVFMPAARLVKPLMADLALVTGANAGLGMAHRGASAALLESRGYHVQAAQYRVMDGTAIAADVILGAAFGFIGRATMRRPTTEQVDAALTERTIQHADIDTAPGLPVDPRSAVAHQDALRAALDALNRGEAVVLPDNIHSATFLRETEGPAPVAPSREQALASAKEELQPVIRAELEQAIAGPLPKVRNVQAELATVAKSLDELDGTFKTRTKEFQRQGQSRKKAEQSARASIDEERAQLTGRQSELNESLAGIRSAEQARADRNALDRGETPKHIEARVNARADEIIQGFERKPLAAGVAAASRTLSPRQTAEFAAREELDTLIREYDATLPRAPDAAPGAKIQEGEAPAKVVTARSGETESGRTQQAAAEGNATGRGGNATQSPKNLTESPENLTETPKTEPSFPELEMLRGAVARNPEAMIRSGYDEDGRPVEVRADEVLQAIEAEHAIGVREASSYTAAITCLLRF